MSLNLYLLMQDDNNDYDTFDSMIVVAENEEQARMIHPDGYDWSPDKNTWVNHRGEECIFKTWAFSIESISVEHVGICSIEGAKPGDIVIKSFNAG